MAPVCEVLAKQIAIETLKETQSAENNRKELNVAAGLDAHRQQCYVVAL
jgi:hypothetical protein